MTGWLRRLRGSVGMAVTWAVAWALAGVAIGVASGLLPGLPWDILFDVFDAPLPALSVPGFFSGAIFSVVLGIAARRRRFDELSLPGFTALGALGGLLLTLLPVAGGIAEGTVGVQSAVVAGTLVGGLSAASAAGSLVLARRAEDSELLEAADDVAEVGLSKAESRVLLGD